MKNQTSLFAAVALGTAVAIAGCLGSDPNKNSMLFEGGGGAAGTTSAAGGNGGSNSITGPIPTTATALATFDVAADAGVASFVLNPYPDTNRTNLGSSASTATVKPTLIFDDTEGSPDTGSLKVTAPYSGADQYVDIQKTFGATDLQNWMGKKLHVRVKVDAGSTFAGGAQLYANTTTSYAFGGNFTNVAKNSGWQEFTLDVNTPLNPAAGYDPTKVISFGVQLATGSAGGSATPVTFHVDTFWLE
jgi:hypothetical protein